MFGLNIWRGMANRSARSYRSLAICAFSLDSTPSQVGANALISPSFTMILAIVFLLLVAAISNTLLAVIVSTLDRWLPGLGYLWQILRWLISFGLIVTVFAAMYTILPDVEIHWRNTLMGATIAALLFLAGQALFGVFLSMTNIGSGYGVAGSFLIIITWIFYAAQVLFSGAVFTKVYARQRGVPIVPSEFAVSTSTTNLR
jgi:membrane protein